MLLPAEQLDKLKRLLVDTAGTRKHSAYQLLATPVKELLGDVGVDIRSKHEFERLAYMQSKVDFQGRKVLDIGCNTGFFLFESLQADAVHVTGYEGSAAHAAFVEEAARLLQLEKSLEIRSRYFDFETLPGHFDIAFLLNVLHHVGDDYGDPALTIEQAKVSILKQLNRMSRVTDRLIFQLGFNWRGDPARGLFTHGTKAEMIEYIREGTSGFWKIEAIGVAERRDGELTYRDVDERNIQRDNALGEFLNRPIFIMNSLGARE
ncbi:class I SAM-dependent methyltransferase [Zestomonas carbonaria]|uniref:tRNA U34 carboxymethyltransferase n=1 Tax=Zestomonas carbonaria TaxID=2762745 RepID=A0A7U7ER18_9GAMM|nr:class I SAM-dependent methyltransferase [Pseudomonas carbonaria]CAD5109258.1 tRNA U34 carboxymethyltransferase [Pseudomonas carbonaria]